MPTYSSPSSSPPPTPSRRKLKSCARRCERACCTVATYFPLFFIYSLTTWAVWVQGNIGLGDTGATGVTRLITASSALGIFLYILLNTCYTVAVFTDPGSPQKSDKSKRRGKYSILPTNEPGHDLPEVENITVSSGGGARFCKKCHTPKPDRAHHCSTCKRCVLKMDHHCPWLATCLGLHNYKAFILFLVYTSVFCWVCLGTSGWWMYTQLIQENTYVEDFAPVNIILLSVVSGIIGIVLTGFTGWHLYLCTKGQTTIECLEKTRYLSGVRSRVERHRQEQANSHHKPEGVAETIQRAGEQILEFHANAVPGAFRYEEGEEHASPAPSVHNANPFNDPVPARNQYEGDRNHSSPALQSLRRTYSAAESQRERDRYEEYINDRDSEKLPNAFDLGWRRNLLHLFGPNPLAWWLPVCNTTGDGWRWEVSEKWRLANEEVARRKEERLRAATDANSTSQYSDNIGIRGGGPYHSNQHRNVDGGAAATGEHYGRSAMSLQTLNTRHPNTNTSPNTDRSRPKQRRDYDQAEEGGEVETFQVSGSSSSDGGSDSEAGYSNSNGETDHPNYRKARRKRRFGGSGGGRTSHGNAGTPHHNDDTRSARRGKGREDSWMTDVDGWE